MSQAITSSVPQVLAGPAAFKQVAEHLLASDLLVQGTADLATRKTEGHLCDVHAANRLAAREGGPVGLSIQPVLRQGDGESNDDDSQVRRSTKKGKASGKIKRETDGQSSRSVPHATSDSEEDH